MTSTHESLQKIAQAEKRETSVVTSFPAGVDGDDHNDADSDDPDPSKPRKTSLRWTPYRDMLFLRQVSQTIPAMNDLKSLYVR